MDSDERQIVDFLKSCPEQFVGGREICRRAGTKKQYREEPNWAMPILPRMVEQRILETDGLGHYKVAPEKKKEKKRWVSPEIQKILEESGKDFGEAAGTPDLDPPNSEGPE